MFGYSIKGEMCGGKRKKKGILETILFYFLIFFPLNRSQHGLAYFHTKSEDEQYLATYSSAVKW